MFTIVCLIGSTKFESTFRKLEEELSLAGYLVFSPLVYTQSGEPPLCGVQNKKVLDEVQKAKINYSHIVLVVDEKGYIDRKCTNDKCGFVFKVADTFVFARIYKGLPALC